MISGIVDFKSNHKAYISHDLIFLNRNITFCSEDYRNLIIGHDFISVHDDKNCEAKYSETEESLSLSCGNSENAVMYYTFIGTCLVFSGEIKDIIQKCRDIINDNSITTQKLSDVLKSIVTMNPGDKVEYTEKGLICL